MPVKPVSVSQLNNYINRVLSTDPILMNVSVCGEIANLTKHSSGHWYFSLKDKDSSIKCFLPSSRISGLRFDLDEGMEIIAYGSISVYEKGGYYSFNVRNIDALGEGTLQQAFEKLKIKLEKEGLFSEEHKRPVPVFPSRIAVITSPTGAAIKDIITTVKRRNPFVDILLYPVLVQGEGSASSICNALAEINSKHSDCDTIILGRGGGSAEDLWSFNEETVARAVYKSEIPVISAVGHEIDYVISDFVADLRAATPTAAAELAVPHINTFIDRISSCNPERMHRFLIDRIEIGSIKIFRLYESVFNSVYQKIIQYDNNLKLIKLDIDSSNPLLVLDKGYAAVKNEDGRWICDGSCINIGDTISLVMKNYRFNCTVESKEKTDGQKK